MTNANPAFKPEKLFNYAPTFSGLEPLADTEFADSGDMVCIETSKPMLKYLLGAWELFRYSFVIQGDDTERQHTHEQLLELHTQIMLADACEVCEPQTPCVPSTCELPDCIEITETSIEIDAGKCDDMTINIYNNCGCGCGCGGGGQTNADGLTGTQAGQAGAIAAQAAIDALFSTGGVQPANAITQCDFITTSIPAIIDQMTELVRTIDDNNANLDGALEAVMAATDTLSIPQDVLDFIGETVSSVLQAGSGAILTMLLDIDFQYRVQESWARNHSDGGYITNVRYVDMLATVIWMPQTWVEGTTILFPRVLLPLLYRLIDYNKTNARLIVAKDTANQGLCDYIFAGAGLTYEAPPDQSSFPNPSIPFPYDWGVYFDFLPSEDGWAVTLDHAVWTLNEGFSGNLIATGGNHWQCVINKSFSATLTGARLYYDRPFGGNLNAVNIGTTELGGQYYDIAHAGENIIDAEFDAVHAGSLFIAGAEWNSTPSDTTDHMTMKLQRLELFGTGTAPAIGTPF